MKTITTLTAIAALIAGMSVAVAQNAGGSAAPGASPNNINKGSMNSTQSGNEAGSTAMKPANAKSTTGAGMQSPSKDVAKSPASTDAGVKQEK